MSSFKQKDWSAVMVDIYSLQSTLYSHCLIESSQNSWALLLIAVSISQKKIERPLVNGLA